MVFGAHDLHEVQRVGGHDLTQRNPSALGGPHTTAATPTRTEVFHRPLVTLGVALMRARFLAQQWSVCAVTNSGGKRWRGFGRVGWLRPMKRDAAQVQAHRLPMDFQDDPQALPGNA